jgi:3alpha(or 20beta)-hydroxysteroid dehydrogenase
MGRLSGKVAIITGASQGMGEAHARLFVAEGAKVILTDVNDKDGQVVADSLGANAMFIKQDVRDAAGWKDVVAKAEAKYGTVTVLVNNAGIIGTIADTVNFKQEDYQLVCDINQLSVYLGMQAVIPSMIKAGGGSIVNISSIAGMLACMGAPNLAYVGSKFAVRGMTKQVAAEYGPKNVRCNSVHPGFILTPMMVAATDENGGGAGDLIPLKRMAAPKEVSQLVLFLASDDSSFITGMEHVIDGGMTAC